VASVDAGVPVNLTDGTGDTLLVLAAPHGRPDTVAALLTRGADPDDGQSSARATATFFELPEMTRLLDGA
jgi:ankyrin repeat protein